MPANDQTAQQLPNHIKRLVKEGVNKDSGSVQNKVITQIVLEGYDTALHQVLSAHRYWEVRNRGIEIALAALEKNPSIDCFKVVANADIAERDNILKITEWAHKAQWDEALVYAIGQAGRFYELPPSTVTTIVSLTDHKSAIHQLYEMYKNHNSSWGMAALLESAVTTGFEAVAKLAEAWGSVPPGPNDLAQGALRNYKDGPKDTRITALFLDAGANVNYENGALMVRVLQAGDLTLAERMINDHQFEMGFFESHVYPALLKESAPATALAFAKERASKSVIVADDGVGFQRIDEVSIARTQTLPNAGVLTMVFNFGTGQQILIAQMGEQVAPPTVVPFSQIQTTALLSQAATAFVAAGGKLDVVSQAGVEFVQLPKKAPSV